MQTFSIFRNSPWISAALDELFLVCRVFLLVDVNVGAIDQKVDDLLFSYFEIRRQQSGSNINFPRIVVSD